MVFFERYLNLKERLNRKSHFLFGPRGTGKSSLWAHQLKERCVPVNLLRGDMALRLSAHPEDLEAIVSAQMSAEQPLPIVIDEVQKIPALLDEVHRLIEERRWTFLLTGSSARKLKRGGANLLAGRAWISDLFPLVSHEIPEFSLDKALRYGTLPSVWLSPEPEEDLDAYVRTYLYEEIQAEGLVRSLPKFSRFLEAAAVSTGEPINYTAIASDSEVPASSVREFYRILEDTLLGFQLEPWTGSVKRKAVQSAKFYFFDTGVRHTICRTKHVEPGSDIFGKSLEQWIGAEIRAWMSYSRNHDKLCYWRSKHGAEVDFLIGHEVAVEVKAAARVKKEHFKGLEMLGEENRFSKRILVSLDPTASRVQGIDVWPWQRFLEEMWAGRIT